MIGGLRQLRAIWAHAGALRKFGRILTRKPVLRAATNAGIDLGTEAAYRGAQFAQKSQLIRRNKKIGRIVRKGLFGLDVAGTVGFFGLGIHDYLQIDKSNKERDAAVRRFKSNLERTERRLQRVRRVTK